MKRFLKKLVLVVVALWLPVQASAVPLLVVMCPDSETGALHSHTGLAHEHHDADTGTPQDSQDPTHTHGDTAHFCCHHFSALFSTFTVDRAGPPGFARSVVLVREYRFFPEPGNRPPLAHLV